ncbi:hypothetical protein [Mycolicibacterium austroafricanum]|uniref:hypothetical protein n=1 Tax=Mycolicibacterium austroafricanum TaxID=39687 RepID=UPI00056485F4|nr:hypothetical protein [Mycolicibacterium austroafricanum]
MASITMTLRYRADTSKYPAHVQTQAQAAQHDIDNYANGEISLAELFDAVGEDQLTFVAGD